MLHQCRFLRQCSNTTLIDFMYTKLCPFVNSRFRHTLSWQTHFLPEYSKYYIRMFLSKNNSIDQPHGRLCNWKVGKIGSKFNFPGECNQNAFLQSAETLTIAIMEKLVTPTYVECMYQRIYNALNSNSLSSHECAPVGQTENMCL